MRGVRISQRYLTIAFVVVVMLAFLTFAAMPKVDSAEQDVLFFLRSLPVFYYFSLVGTFLFAVLCERKPLSLFSAILFGFLTLFTPYSLFAAPWFQDIYYYVGEAMSVVIMGVFGFAGHSERTPGISLFSSSYLLITGVEPLAFSSFYAGLVVVLLTLVFYGIAEELGASRPSIAPLAFFSICWQDELHLCRISLSVLLYLTFVLLALPCREESERERGYADVLASLLVVPVLAISHPSTPLVAVLGLVGAVLVFRFVGERRPRNVLHAIRMGSGNTVVLALTWLTWNTSIIGFAGMQVFVDFMNSIVRALTFGSGWMFPEQTLTRLSPSTYTSEYYAVIQMKLVHWIIVFSVAVLVFLVYRFHRDFTTLMTASLFLVGQSTFLVSLFSGLSYTSRPSFYTYLMFPLVLSIACRPRLRNQTRTNDRLQQILSIAALVFIFLSAAFLPVLNHSDTAFLYMPTHEHAALVFSIKNLPDNQSLASTSYNAPGPFYSKLLGRSLGPSPLGGADWRTILSNKTELRGRLRGLAVLVFGSCSTRDAFWRATPTFGEAIDILTANLHVTHSRVYDCKENVCLFVPPL